MTSLDQLLRLAWYYTSHKSVFFILSYLPYSRFVLSASNANVYVLYTQMGYGKTEQTGSGIHFRQYSRAFVVQDSSNNRVALICADIGMATQIVKIEVNVVIVVKYVCLNGSAILTISLVCERKLANACMGFAVTASKRYSY